ncbi:MAG: hypothetical protein ACFBZ9_02635 [Sphingomonadales bacterium]
MATLKSLRSDIDEVGVLAVSFYWLGRVLKALKFGRCGFYLIMGVDLKQVIHGPSRRHEEPFVLEPLLVGHRLREQLDAPMDVIDQRYESGACCHALLTAQGDLDGAIWSKRGTFEEDEFRAIFDLPTDAVWDFGVFIPPARRAGRSLSRLWQGFATTMSKSGVARSISRIEVHNRASLRAHKRLPHSELGKLAIVRIGALEVALSTLKPKLHISWSSTMAPRYDLRAVL